LNLALRRRREVAEEGRGKPVLEENILAERGSLGGRTIETTAEGKFVRRTLVASCVTCGQKLDNYVLCFSCLGALCSDCATKMNGIPYCRQHLMEVLPLSRNGYKALMCVEAGVDDVSEIHDITKIPKDDVKASLAFLAERKLITTSGLFTFLERKITADGLHALSVYKKVYTEEDVAAVEQRLNGESNDGD
jgi:hypothetical protein